MAWAATHNSIVAIGDSSDRPELATLSKNGAKVGAGFRSSGFIEKPALPPRAPDVKSGRYYLWKCSMFFVASTATWPSGILGALPSPQARQIRRRNSRQLAIEARACHTVALVDSFEIACNVKILMCSACVRAFFMSNDG